MDRRLLAAVSALGLAAAVAAGAFALTRPDPKPSTTGPVRVGPPQEDETTTTTGPIRTTRGSVTTTARAGTATTRAPAPLPPSTCKPEEVTVTLTHHPHAGPYYHDEMVTVLAEVKNTSNHPCHYPGEASIVVVNGGGYTVWGRAGRVNYPAEAGPGAPANWAPGYTLRRTFEWDQSQCLPGQPCDDQAPPGRYTAKASFHSKPSGAESYDYGEGVVDIDLAGAR